MEFITVAALGVAGVACATDLRDRRIPNWLTFGAAAAALLFHAWEGGWSGAMSSAGGWLLGVALFMPFFALRGLGGGDVKLLGAIGAWLGPSTVLYVALYAAIAGGVLGVIVAIQAKYLRTALSNIKFLMTSWWAVGLKPVDGLTLDDHPAPKLAYAIPILTGLMVTIWLR